MSVTPYTNVSEGKKEQVEKMFNEIAFRYDLLNQLLSFGIHKSWRRKAIRFINSEFKIQNSEFVLLDVATGTGDFAIDAVALNPKEVIGIDIAEDMLAIGRKKLEQKRLSHIIKLQQADSENLPFPENYFDAATVGFGVRNFENLEKGLSEICRTLKKGGTFAVLEFSIPEKFPMKQLYNLYLANICPLLGRIVSKNPIAYTYLFKSVSNFPYGEKFKTILLNCGFSEAKVYPQTFGITTIYVAKK
ncbi:MAG: bifunctional demethylmenaquinone methyltransferase/2-methoxy-6-polyprenyl-1,4-benzoquinol methylase UbiE [Bacteroidetes bacterium]|nr:bifunctional demethylmenaquinone methyltransferase/2-methoxy-6-polyprenyl-1,4-benzoquinol methylase UbiE [Bacteroidota bacterium]